VKKIIIIKLIIFSLCPMSVVAQLAFQNFVEGGRKVFIYVPEKQKAFLYLTNKKNRSTLSR